MTWRPARSIPALFDQLQRAAPRAAPPATPASSWGMRGDAAHSSTSDHAPKNFAGWGSEIVTAGDIPHAPGLGLDFGVVAEALRRSRDPRIKYVIFNGRMFSSYATSLHSAWTWRPYSGDNPHRTHGHVSVVGDARADGTQPWSIGIGGGDIDMADAAEIITFLSKTIERGNLWPISGKLDALIAEAAADKARDLTTQAAIKALADALNTALASPGEGGAVDTTSILRAIDSAANRVRAEVLAAQERRDKALSDALKADDSDGSAPAL